MGRKAAKVYVWNLQAVSHSAIPQALVDVYIPLIMNSPLIDNVSAEQNLATASVERPVSSIASVATTACVFQTLFCSAGRDLSFLVLSYVINMLLTLGSLFLVKQSGLGVVGSFLCLCQFQVVRLVVNGVQLTRGGNSPLNRREPLKSWITDDVKAAVA